MAEIGIMGSSGDFRTNRTSDTPGAKSISGGIDGGINTFLEGKRRNRQLSHEQFMQQQQHEQERWQTAAGMVSDRNAAKQTRKTMKTTAGLQQKQIEHARANGVVQVGGNFATGEHNAVLGKAKGGGGKKSAKDKGRAMADGFAERMTERMQGSKPKPKQLSAPLKALPAGTSKPKATRSMAETAEQKRAQQNKRANPPAKSSSGAFIAGDGKPRAAEANKKGKLKGPYLGARYF